jgi:hypothetical protein
MEHENSALVWSVFRNSCGNRMMGPVTLLVTGLEFRHCSKTGNPVGDRTYDSR